MSCIFGQKMESEQKANLYSNPHWKSDGSCRYDQDFEGTFTVLVRALNITWGNDIRFWQPIKFTEDESQSTGFEEGRKLLQVNWIEVTGKIPTNVFYAKRYEIYYIVKFQIDAFGWHYVPVKFKVRLSGEELSERSMILHAYRKKHDTWYEIHGGEFKVSIQTVGLGLESSKNQMMNECFATVYQMGRYVIISPFHRFCSK